MYDAVIVGARCAGSPLAMLLARGGHNVLLVDRATFPSDTMSTHAIQTPGMARLARWGLLEDVMALGAPPITKFSFGVGDDLLEIDVPLHARPSGVAAPRRTVLDKLLVDRAVEAGAELATGISVDSLITEGDRILGVRGHSSEGSFEARGRIVVGADGRHSVVAREVDAQFAQFHGGTSAGYYTYYSDVEMNGGEAYMLDGLFTVAFPTNDGATVVAAGWPQERFPEIRRDVEGNFLAVLDQCSDLGARVRAGKQAERFVGLADVPNYLRTAVGAGWALVGDAACHKDPTPADGISDAFRGAEYLAEAIDAFLSGRQDETTALAAYDRRHREVVGPLLHAAFRSASYDLTLEERTAAFMEIRAHDTEEMEELLAMPTSV